MAQEAPDYWEAKARPGPHRSEGVSEIMQPNFVEPGLSTDCKPRLFEVSPWPTLIAADDNISGQLGN